MNTTAFDFLHVWILFENPMLYCVIDACVRTYRCWGKSVNHSVPV